MHQEGRISSAVGRRKRENVNEISKDRSLLTKLNREKEREVIPAVKGVRQRS